jgi:hypothetical protein
MPQAVVVLGARNLGGAIIDHFLALGWNAAGVARSEGTLDRVRTAGALALQADASDPQSLASALERARLEPAGDERRDSTPHSRPGWQARRRPGRRRSGIEPGQSQKTGSRPDRRRACPPSLAGRSSHHSGPQTPGFRCRLRTTGVTRSRSALGRWRRLLSARIAGATRASAGCSPAAKRRSGQKRYVSIEAPLWIAARQMLVSLDRSRQRWRGPVSRVVWSRRRFEHASPQLLSSSPLGAEAA